MPELNLFVVFALVAGLYMAWTIGANDVANAMGTSVGSKALTLGAAIAVAAVFEFSGAFFAGGRVATTIKAGVIDLDTFAETPQLISIGMLSALIGAAVWLHFATWRGWPDSTTHSIVGAVAGVGILMGGFGVIQWGVVTKIVIGWFISPLLGGAVAWLLFSILRRVVFGSDHPARRARIVTPVVVGAVGFVLTLSMIFKGLQNLNLDLPFGEALALALAIGVVSYLVVAFILSRITLETSSYDQQVIVVERQFRYLQIVTACYVAFAHGSNDVANAVGPLAAVITSAGSGAISSEVGVPAWIMAFGGMGIVLGLATYGYRVIHTIGQKITELTPSRGFIMEFATASVVLLGSKIGVPVSTTHILIGAVVGVGMARGMGAINMRVVRVIFLSWLITVPAAGTVAELSFLLLRQVL